MFLAGDAKLWWRTRVGADKPHIQTWEQLKVELKGQFLPSHGSWLAHEALKRLKQTGSVREYVKQFSSLMLDIEKMTDEDRLFNFMSGLQAWAQTELRRQDVKDLQTAMAAVDALVDLRTFKATDGAGSKIKDKGK